MAHTSIRYESCKCFGKETTGSARMARLTIVDYGSGYAIVSGNCPKHGSSAISRSYDPGTGLCARCNTYCDGDCTAALR